MSNVSEVDVDVEDSAFLTMGIQSSSKSEIIVSLSMDFVRRDSHRTCFAIGDLGTLTWDALSGLINLYDPSLGRWLLHIKVLIQMCRAINSNLITLYLIRRNPMIHTVI